MIQKAALFVAIAGASVSVSADNTFIDDASLDLGFRTFYMHSTDKEGHTTHDALGQGVRVTFESGYFHDVIGVDAGVYTGFGLHTNDPKESWGMLGAGNSDLIKHNLVLKANLFGYGNIKYGTRFVDLPLYCLLYTSPSPRDS